MNGAGYGLTYGGPSEPIPFDEWEREPSHPLAAEFMPSFVDAYGFKRVLPEPMSTLATYDGVVEDYNGQKTRCTHRHTWWGMVQVEPEVARPECFPAYHIVGSMRRLYMRSTVCLGVVHFPDLRVSTNEPFLQPRDYMWSVTV